MFTIRIGNKRIKVINWLIFITFILLVIYIIGSCIFLIPIFKKTYNYNLKKENYQLKKTTTFKNAWFKCNIKEEYIILSKDKLIYNTIEKDLINDGFKNKNNKYIKVSKNFGICKDEKKEYEKTHSKSYVTFKLNGKDKEKINYGDIYNDPYVTSKINGNNIKNIEVSSNFNKDKIGEYIVTYTLNITKTYKQRLYRKLNVIDKEAPNIELVGENELTIDYGSNYLEPGYTSVDNYDGNITDKVKVNNKVNTKKSGLYKIVYEVKDSSNNVCKVQRDVIVKEKDISVLKEEPKIEVKEGITYVNGVLIVNKTYDLPKDYDPKINKEALKALKAMQADAKVLGLNLPLVSGYRSYTTQKELYNKYVKKDGEKVANTYSAKPGHSEHQTGLSFDVGSVDRSFANTDESKWLEENAHLYGFIIRYPKDKTNITGYIYEPWHVRYLGKDLATKVKLSGLCLEEYLGL